MSPLLRKTPKIGSSSSGYFAFPPVPGHSWSRSLWLTITPLRGGSTVVMAQTEENWNRAAPKSAVLPSRIQRVDIASRYYGERKSVLVHVRDRFEVASIVSWTNGLSFGPVNTCFGLIGWGYGGGPTVTLTFRSASERVLAQAQVNPDGGLPLSGPCNPFRLTIGNRDPVGLIGADILLRIQRLLNIDVAPVTPSVVSGCLRRDGWIIHTHHGPPVRLVAIHRGRMWAITFHLSGKVTTNAPPARAVARCLRTPQFYGFR